jgi:hypothetical protein
VTDTSATNALIARNMAQMEGPDDACHSS